MSKVVEMLKEKGIAERIQRNVDSVVKELGIKYNPDSAKNLSDFDKAMYSAVDRLVKTICQF